MGKLVSVIMPMHDAGRFVADAIRSCRDQTYPDWELVVVDDASNDASADIVERFQDPRVRLIRLEENMGPGLARNVALDAARGEWITVLDADDLYHCRRLEHLMSLAEEHGSGHVFLDRMARWELSKTPNEGLLRGDLQGGLRQWQLSDWVAAEHGGRPFFHASALAKRNVRYPDTRAAQDTGFFIRLVRLNELVITESLAGTYIYRRVAGSLVARTPHRLEERARTYQLLCDEFGDDEPLLAALRGQLEVNRREEQVLQVREAMAARSLSGLVRALRSSPGLTVQLVRRVPAWARSNLRIKKRREAQRREITH